jgi:hypothetical protein
MAYSLARELLPNELGEVEIQMSACPDANSHQDAKELIQT